MLLGSYFACGLNIRFHPTNFVVDTLKIGHFVWRGLGSTVKSTVRHGEEISPDSELAWGDSELF